MTETNYSTLKIKMITHNPKAYGHSQSGSMIWSAKESDSSMLLQLTDWHRSIPLATSSQHLMATKNSSGRSRMDSSSHLSTAQEEVAFHLMAPTSSQLLVTAHSSLSSSYVLICNMSTILRMIPANNAHLLAMNVSIMWILAPLVLPDSMLGTTSPVGLAWLAAITANLKMHVKNVIKRIISRWTTQLVSASRAISSPTTPNAIAAHLSWKAVQSVQPPLLVRPALTAMISTQTIFARNLEETRLSWSSSSWWLQFWWWL